MTKARHLLDATTHATIRHLLFISVVGADRVPVVSGIDRAMFGYYAAKRQAEKLIVDSGLPWTILRATQFHEFIVLIAQQLTTLPVVMAWRGVRFQPVDGGEVADRLVQLTLDRPAGMVPAIAGPKTYDMTTLLRDYLQARQLRRPILPLRMPGRAAAAMRDGANLAGDDTTLGHRTWEDFLAGTVRARTAR